MSRRMIYLLMFFIGVFCFLMGKSIGGKEASKPSTPSGTVFETTGEVRFHQLSGRSYVYYNEPIFDELRNCKFKARFEVL